MNKEKDLQKIKALATGEQCNIFWFDEGGGVVYKVYDRLILFEVPQYGINIECVVIEAPTESEHVVFEENREQLEWVAKRKNGDEIDFLMTKGLGCYGPKIYSEPQYACVNNDIVTYKVE